jgi:hypothetical protein
MVEFGEDTGTRSEAAEIVRIFNAITSYHELGIDRFTGDRAFNPVEFGKLFLQECSRDGVNPRADDDQSTRLCSAVPSFSGQRPSHRSIR